MADRITLYTDDINEDDIIEAQKEVFDTDEDDQYGEWDEVPKDAALSFIEVSKEEDWNEIRNEFENVLDGYCVISGRYDTHYPGYPVPQSGERGAVTRNYREFIDFFKDCDYWTIEDDDGLLLIKAGHHDGTYTVAVKVLTDAGIEWYEDYEHEGQIDRREEVETLFNSDKYSKKPYLAKKLGYTN